VLFTRVARLLDLVLPPRCGGCAAVGSWYCERCAEKTRRLEEPLCVRCGAELPFTGSRCNCRLRSVDRIRSAVAMEGPVEAAMHRFKYLGWRSLAAPLARLLVTGGGIAELAGMSAVAVPLHRSRQRGRGFNQAQLLLDELSAQGQLKKLPQRLVRGRSAPPQVGLDRLQRLANLQGAFTWRGEDLRKVPVIVVDDVSTTGATIDACAQALKSGGAGMVIGLTIARVRWF
jgi:ComF family protein